MRQMPCYNDVIEHEKNRPFKNFGSDHFSLAFKYLL